MIILFTMFKSMWAAESDKFIIVVEMVGSTDFDYPAHGTNYTIEWEEVGNEAINNGTLFVTNSTLSLYSTLSFPYEASYRIKVDPTTATSFHRFRSNVNKITDISQWGTTQWTSMNQSFRSNVNLQMTATDIPDLSNCPTLFSMFSSCGSMTSNPSISDWDVSNILSFGGMFSNCYAFNQDLSNWNVSMGNNFSNMFFSAFSYNQPMEDWDMSSATNISHMFAFADEFNQSINSWDVTAVTQANSVFSNAYSFNQSLHNWNLQNVISMNYLFDFSGMDCDNYSHTLEGWASNVNTSHDIVITNSNIFYNSVGTVARQTLIDDYNWSFFDDIQDLSCTGPLSANAVNLTADVRQQQVTLQWSMINDENIAHYLIQSSDDAKSFRTIAQTQDKSHTTYQDNDVQYYRVVAMTKDGQELISNMKKVELTQKSSVSVYPNPVINGTFTINAPQAGDLTLYNGLGIQVLNTKISKGNNNITTNPLPAGTYYALFNGESIKIIIQ